MLNVMDMRRNATAPMSWQQRARIEEVSVQAGAGGDNGDRNGEAQRQLLMILRSQLAQSAVQQLEPPSGIAVPNRLSPRFVSRKSEVPVSDRKKSTNGAFAVPQMSREQAEQLIRAKYFGVVGPTTSATPMEDTKIEAKEAPASVPNEETITDLEKGLETLNVLGGVTAASKMAKQQEADSSTATEKRSNRTSETLNEDKDSGDENEKALLKKEIEVLKSQLKAEAEMRVMYQERCETLESHLKKVKEEAEEGLKLAKSSTTSSKQEHPTAAASTSALTPAPAPTTSGRSNFLKSSGRRGSYGAPRSSGSQRTGPAVAKAQSSSASASAASAPASAPRINEYVDMFNDASEHSAITFMNDASMSGRHFESSATSSHHGRIDQSERTMINTYTQSGSMHGSAAPFLDTSGHGYSFHSRASAVLAPFHQPAPASVRKKDSSAEEHEDVEPRVTNTKMPAKNMKNLAPHKGPKNVGRSRTPTKRGGKLNRGGEINKQQSPVVFEKLDKLGNVLATLDHEFDDDDDDDYSTRTGDYGSRSSSIRSLDSMSDHSSDEEDSDYEDSYGSYQQEKLASKNGATKNRLHQGHGMTQKKNVPGASASSPPRRMMHEHHASGR